jgi:hypothetical protein
VSPARVLFSADAVDEPAGPTDKPNTLPRRPSPTTNLIPPKGSSPNWLAEARGTSFRPGRRSAGLRAGKVPALSLSRLGSGTVSGAESVHSDSDSFQSPQVRDLRTG